MKNKIIVDNITKVYKMYNSPMDHMKEALSIAHKSYHVDFYALKNISFNVNGGEILGIIGRNGAGKSTLLKIITGVLQPSNGNVNVNGTISSLLELGTGFNMEYTGIENIFFYGALMGLNKKKMEKYYDKIVDFAEIGDYIYQPVKTYSSGMFARLAFSCAINIEPDILIVDEILSVGDMRFQAKCFNKFEDFRQIGATILYVGHDVGMMRSFCNHVLWLNNGEIVEYGEPAYITAKYTEFMYIEDDFQFTNYKKFEEENKEEKVKNDSSNLEMVKTQKLDMNVDIINHWGTNVGLIRNVTLVNENGKELTYFSPDDLIKIIVSFDDCISFDYEYLSVAFSIKNKEGTDLIVKTTYDEDILIKKKNNHIVEFSLKTHLSIGEYYLVVALENRKNASITYYEYIEGVKYFKIYSNKKIFGIVDAITDISVY